MRFALRLLSSQIFYPNNLPHQAQKSATIYLKHVKWVTGRAQLENYFRDFGQIKDVSLFFDPVTGLHRGFASITFVSSSSAERAISNTPHFIDGNEVKIDSSIPMDNQKHDKFSTTQQTGQRRQQPPMQRGQNLRQRQPS